MSSTYAIFDTNVLVSSLLKGDSAPSTVLSYILYDKVIPILHKRILAEYNEVLRRRKFDFDEYVVSSLIEEITSRALWFGTVMYSHPLPDEKDRIFLEVLLCARKERDAYLAAGNTRHFPAVPFIVTPVQMYHIIQGVTYASH